MKNQFSIIGLIFVVVLFIAASTGVNNIRPKFESITTDTLYSLNGGSIQLPDTLRYQDGSIQTTSVGTSATGRYQPTDSAQSNVTSLTLDTANWYQVGDMVTVFGTFTLEASSPSTATFFYMDLPVQTVLTTDGVAGVFSAYEVEEAGAVISDGTAQRVVVQFDGVTTTAHVFAFKFSYFVR